MKRRRSLVFCRLAAPVLLAVAAAPLAAGTGKSFLGQEAPEFQASDWIHRPARTSVAEYRGEVLLLEFSATWCPPCRASFPHLIGLSEKYGRRGFNIIILSNESRIQVERYIHQFLPGLRMPIALKAANPYAVTGIPHAYLVGVDGKVVWEGSPASLSDDVVERELRRIRKWKDVEGRRAAKAGKLLDKRQYAKAYAAAAKVLESDRATEADKKSAAEIREYIQALAERRLAWADALAEDGRPDRALTVLEEITTAFKGTEWGTQADRRFAELSRDADAGARVKAEARVAKILDRLKYPVNEKERIAVHRALEKMAAKLEGAAKDAVERWAEIFKEKWVPKRS